MLTFALFASARMGIYQEQVYGKYGKHPGEALFYNVSQAIGTCSFNALWDGALFVAKKWEIQNGIDGQRYPSSMIV